MKPNTILLIGLKPEVVDFSQWPELSVEKLNQHFKEIVAAFAAIGYEADWCLTDRGETAAAAVADRLSTADYSHVLIGAGLRTAPELLLLFEQVINLIHQHAPTAKICFNSNPGDTVEAVKRWA